MRFRFSIGVVAAGAWLVGCSQDPLSAPAARRLTPPWLASVPNVLCRHVSGSFVFTSFQFTSATSAVGAGNVFGDIAGTFSAEYLDLHENGDGSSVMNARHTISTAAGSITTADVIILRPDQNPSIVRPNSRVEVTGGTGAYEGATGQLHTHGEVNLATLDGSIDFKGEVCLPAR
jgi:hypothetical protein